MLRWRCGWRTHCEWVEDVISTVDWSGCIMRPEKLSPWILFGPVDAELIGCSVRVFWPLEGGSKVLARFHGRRRKYRVEYIDGDHEWIDVDEAADRLQLYDASGSWSDFNVAVRPALAGGRTNEPKKLISKYARKIEGGAARGPYSREEVMTGAAATTTRRLWSGREDGGGQGRETERGRTPHGRNSVPVARCCLLDGERARTRTFASSTRDRGARVLRPTVCERYDVPNVRSGNWVRRRCGRCLFGCGLVEGAGSGRRRCARGKKGSPRDAQTRAQEREDLSGVFGVLRARSSVEEDFAADAELVYAAHAHRLNELKVVAEAEQERIEANENVREAEARASGAGPAATSARTSRPRTVLLVECASRPRVSSRSATSVPRTFRSRRGSRARRWPIDWRSARRWRAARGRPG